MNELDLHGLIGDEVFALLPGMLLNEFNRSQAVKIIVGEGTGVVKNKTKEILNSCDFIENYEFAHPIVGGTGVIIVYFKKKIKED